MSITTIAEQPEKLLNKVSSELGAIEVLIGQEALAMVGNDSSLLKWESLYSSCPWATIFQTHSFVASWYAHYASIYTPILVLSRYEGRLTGLLPLAQGIPGLGITGAGGHDAYYHVWLSNPKHGETFIESALQALLQRFPGEDICLKYIPQNVPMGWLQKSKTWKQHCVLRQFSRPLMNLRDIVSEQVVNRRRFKEKYNRLKRLGKVEFELITDSAAFEPILDQLADQYDFRKAATLNIMPFRDDPAKRPFLLDLLQRGILVAAVLKVNGSIISAITVTTEKDGWSHGAGINIHDPAYSRYSPGYVIIKLLGIALKEAGVTTYDITPGGHAYKDAHADEYDNLIELRVTNTYKAFYLQHFYKVKAVLKAVMEKKGVDARQLRKAVSNKLILAKEKLMLLRNSRFPQAYPTNPTATAVNITPSTTIQSNNLEIKRASLKDILLFNPKGTGVTRWEFMKYAMMHYESGFIPFTFCKNNQLLCLVWQMPQSLRADKSEVLHAVRDLPTDSAILCNTYFHSAATDIQSQFLQEVGIRILTTSSIESIYFLGNVDLLAQNSRKI